jgi:hypothetical protein
MPGACPKRVADAWADLWRLPQAVVVGGAGPRARQVARYVRVPHRGRGAQGHRRHPRQEVRQLEDRLGLSSMALLRFRWSIGDVDEADRATPRATEAVVLGMRDYLDSLYAAPAGAGTDVEGGGALARGGAAWTSPTSPTGSSTRESPAPTARPPPAPSSPCRGRATRDSSRRAWRPTPSGGPPSTSSTTSPATPGASRPDSSGGFTCGTPSTPTAGGSTAAASAAAAKGTGKDPLAASHSDVELLAPVRFAGWAVPPSPGRPGIPLAKRSGLPLVQVAANKESQAKDVLRVAVAMLPGRTREEYGVDVGTTRIAVAGGGLLEILTNSESGAEGDPASHITLNESHHMTKSNGGHELAAVCRRNVGKSPGGLARVAEYTNAHQPGRDSVAERAWHAWQDQVAGKTPKRDILYDSREAEPGITLDDVEAVRRGLRQAYADAPWSDLERLLDEVYDPETSAADARRFYLNNNTAAEDALLDPGLVDAAIVRTKVAGAKLRPGDAVVLFGDGSKSDDATGVVACRLSDGLVDVIHHQQPTGDRLADREWCDGDVDDAFDRLRRRAFHFDPSAAKDDRHRRGRPLLVADSSTSGTPATAAGSSIGP